jgi:hypothetical protein
MANLPTHSKVVHYPGSHVFDKTVGCLDETKEDLSVVIRGEIEADGSLVAISHRIVPRIKPFFVISGPRALMSGHFSLRWFDLDHICPHIGEEHCCKRSCKCVCDVKDA